MFNFGLGDAVGKFLSNTLENWVEHKKERVVVKRALDRLLTELELKIREGLPDIHTKHIRNVFNRFKRSKSSKQFVEEMQIIFEDD